MAQPMALPEIPPPPPAEKRKSLVFKQPPGMYPPGSTEEARAALNAGTATLEQVRAWQLGLTKKLGMAEARPDIRSAEDIEACLAQLKVAEKELQANPRPRQTTPTQTPTLPSVVPPDFGPLSAPGNTLGAVATKPDLSDENMPPETPAPEVKRGPGRPKKALPDSVTRTEPE